MDVIVTRMNLHLQSHCRSQERDPSGEEDQVLCCSSKVPAGGPVHFGQVQILVKFKLWPISNFGQFKFWSSLNFGQVQILISIK